MTMNIRKKRNELCLSSIIMSPLNGYVKMSPYETGDICIEPERIATSGCDFILREGGPGVCQSRLTAPPNASTCQTTQIPVTARRGGGSGTSKTGKEGNPPPPPPQHRGR